MYGALETGIELAFSMFIGLAFAYSVNAVMNAFRLGRAFADKLTPSGMIAFLKQCLSAIGGAIAIVVLFEFYILWIWRDGWPGFVLAARRMLLQFLGGRSSWMILGFGFAITLIVLYFHMREQREARK